MKRAVTSLALTLACMAASATSISLTGTVRDFAADSVNFEGNPFYSGPGFVMSTLTGSAPTLSEQGASTGAGGGHIANTGAGAFDNWYNGTANSISHSIVLNETSAGSGLYTYSNNNFFPIDNQLLGNTPGWGHNYHFTYAIAATFSYIAGAGQIFNFSGDDDVWVFFDNQLGIDLGGVHGTQTANVNLDTVMAGKASGDYSFNFFFAERHTTGSNLTITTSLVLRDPGTVPEPSGLLLAGLALAALGATTSRRSAR